MKTSILLASVVFAAGVATAAEIDTPALWKQHCLKCHGAEGKADTKMGKTLKLRDYSDPEVQKAMTDEEIVKATAEGVTVDGKEKMKPFKDKLSEEEIAALAKLVRSFEKKP
jgi:cytochrome c6